MKRFSQGKNCRQNTLFHERRMTTLRKTTLSGSLMHPLMSHIQPSWTQVEMSRRTLSGPPGQLHHALPYLLRPCSRALPGMSSMPRHSKGGVLSIYLGL
jgi:hypothetical protein